MNSDKENKVSAHITSIIGRVFGTLLSANTTSDVSGRVLRDEVDKAIEAIENNTVGNNSLRSLEQLEKEFYDILESVENASLGEPNVDNLEDELEGYEDFKE